MDNQRNSYRLLRVQPEAPHALITRIYRTLMQQLRLHPDLGGDTTSAALINQAYRTVTHPKHREQLDAALAKRGPTLARIGSGPLAGYQKYAATARHNNVNRRHYARVLMLQLDAESALLDTARKWALQQSHLSGNRELIERAYAVMVEPDTRLRYTTLLASHSHNAALALMQQEAMKRQAEEKDTAGSKPDDQATKCPYCQTRPAPVLLTPEPRCATCTSPLQPPPDFALAAGRRQVSRLGKADRVQLSVGWPSSQYSAYLLDASPQGVSFLCNVALHHLPVVRLDSAGFSAVVELTHGRMSKAGNQYGGRFLTASFENAQGTFFQQSA